ncbi:unnamed protein product [Clavelina lepadiformis]|uniref:Uncharacterized protein n=1 Tax=Clavelina lepadiformis TaxID=159417 RepID=A0ABP0GYF2_CLALP
MGNIGTGIRAIAFKNINEVARNVLVLASTIGVNQVIKLIAFKCPCISKSELDAGHTNYWYGMAYFFAPAVVLFLIGIILHLDTWKWLTGCCRRLHHSVNFSRKDHSIAACLSMSKVMGVALLLSSAWVSVSLLDGDFMACALTPLPYNFSTLQSCDDISSLKTTDDYNYNKRRFQIIGWVFLPSLCFVVTLAYMLIRCFSPRSYYHAMYHRQYRKMEEEAIKLEINGNERTMFVTEKSVEKSCERNCPMQHHDKGMG